MLVIDFNYDVNSIFNRVNFIKFQDVHRHKGIAEIMPKKIKELFFSNDFYLFLIENLNVSPKSNISKFFIKFVGSITLGRDIKISKIVLPPENSSNMKLNYEEKMKLDKIIRDQTDKQKMGINLIYFFESKDTHQETQMDQMRKLIISPPSSFDI